MINCIILVKHSIFDFFSNVFQKALAEANQFSIDEFLLLYFDIIINKIREIYIMHKKKNYHIHK